MVIYGGMGDCACTVNGAGTSICVLGPCLAHTWVFFMSLQFGTCPGGRICNQVSMSKRRPQLSKHVMIVPPLAALCPEDTLGSMLSSSCRSTYVPRAIVKMQQPHVGSTVVSMS